MADTLVWLDCPYGKRHDPAPGSCALYIDTNHNQICDHSEPPPEKFQNRLGGKWIIETNLVFFAALFAAVVSLAIWYLQTQLQPRWLSWRWLYNWVFLTEFVLTAGSGFVLLGGIRHPWIQKIHLISGASFVVLAFFHLWQHRHFFTASNPKLNCEK